MPPLPPARSAAIACVTAAIVALGLGACGRRGPLEPPPGAAAAPPPVTAAPADPRVRPGRTSRTTSAPTSTRLTTQPGSVVEDVPEDEENEEDATLSVTPTPTPRRRVREFTVPKDPFVLDPLL